jgi:ubiquinone/menaquinone biosynthesis C-methylase UbiE
MKKNKFILDACCGPKMMWVNKYHPNTIYIDERKGKYLNKKICPDIIMDNRKMDFKDKSFKLVVCDPPHIIQRKSNKSFLIASYGCLSPETWQSDLKQMIKECMRVLEDYGILIFKWNNCKKKLKDILYLINYKPLFVNKINGASKGGSDTFWCCFMKIPKEIKK